MENIYFKRLSWVKSSPNLKLEVNQARENQRLQERIYSFLRATKLNKQIKEIGEFNYFSLLKKKEKVLNCELDYAISQANSEAISALMTVQHKVESFIPPREV
jgi:thermostable 8-oxoguanine DNA glycosylase